jgi:hypothetical protein
VVRQVHVHGGVVVRQVMYMGCGGETGTCTWNCGGETGRVHGGAVVRQVMHMGVWW